MSIPLELFYSKSHEWVKFDDNGNAVVGLTDFAQQSLGELVFVNLCQEGDNFSAEDVIGDVESIKAVSDINTPVDGVVEEVNQDVLDNAGLINESPYEAWLIKLSGVTDKSSLMNADEYKELIEKEA